MKKNNAKRDDAQVSIAVTPPRRGVGGSIAVTPLPPPQRTERQQEVQQKALAEAAGRKPVLR